MNISPSMRNTGPEESSRPPFSARGDAGPSAEQAVALVAAFNLQGEILLLKRPDIGHCAGLWSFPGGKIIPGESALAAAGRELQEESGLTGEQWQQLGESRFRYPDRSLHFFFSAASVPTRPDCTRNRRMRGFRSLT